MSDEKPTTEAERQDSPPPKKGRGRPRKNPVTKPSDEPVIKRPRGRPPGSKNKKKKQKEKPTGPKRPRGRPRKWAVASEEKEEKSTSGTADKDGNASE